jgi:hypothetical protein
MQQFLAMVDRILMEEQGTRGRLGAILECVTTEIYTKQVKLFSAIYNDVNRQSQLLQQEERLRAMWGGFVDRLTRIVEEGKEKGEIEETFPTDILVSSFLSLFFSPALRYLTKKGYGQEEIFRHVGHLYCDGALAKARQSESNQ